MLRITPPVRIRALARIRVEGTYDRINHRYFPFSIY